ncbi:MOSC domain-containing protein [Cognatiyoonia sp.]|uniref:MOSC domain-containing protein n=1 Tax=Cognatiyoonia sp. TaxID=2211652 RepID=UPI003F6987BD
MAGLAIVTPETLRHNVVVSRINLQALKNPPIRIGSVILKIEGPCPPCSRMEKSLRRGGYNAMRGHGGRYARVIEAGDINVGSANH